MQDIEVLNKHGLSPEKLKPILTEDPTTMPQPVKDLLQRHQDRINNGITRSIRDAHHYAAIDRITKVASKNIPYMLARSMVENGSKESDVIKWFQHMNVGNLIEPVLNADGTPVKDTSDNPVMQLSKNWDQVFIPFVGSYRNMRLAKLCNDRDTFPRYKFTPPRLTEDSLVQTEVLTSRIARMTADLGYSGDDRQAFRQMLDYGFALTFAREPWYKEEATVMDGGSEKKVVTREGVRWITPHPTRVFYDLSHPLRTINSDSGVSFMGYWDIVRYGDMKADPNYWNVDKVNYGSYGFLGSPAWTLYQQLYPCSLKFPSIQAQETAAGQDGNDRLAQSSRPYTANDYDAAVTQVVIFDKIIPSQHGLGTYDQPVWMRFIYGDVGTIIYAEPFAYTPGYATEENMDDNDVLPSSLALELSPFQQQFRSFLLSHAKAVRKNLSRIAFYNTNIINPDALEKLRRRGESISDDLLTLIPFNKDKMSRTFGETPSADAVEEVKFPYLPTTDVESHIRMLLNVVERMLGYTAQEVGASASHEQSATESNILSANASVRLEFTGAGVDAGINAKKRILVEAFAAYGTDEVFVEVAGLNAERLAALEKIGFTVEEGTQGKSSAGFRGSKKKLRLDVFISERDGVKRLSDSKVGVAMLQMLGVAMGNPLIIQRVGIDQIITLLGYVFRMTGMPDDFRLRALPTPDGGGMPEDAEKIKGAIQQSVAGVADQIIAKSVELSGQQAMQAVAPIAQAVQQLAAMAQQLKSYDDEITSAVQQMQQQDAAAAGALEQLRTEIQQLGVMHAEVVENQRGAATALAQAASQSVGFES